MRFMVLLASSGLAVGAAHAQASADWDGIYLGVSGGVSGLSPDTAVSMDIARVGHPDAVYTNPTYAGGASSFDTEISSDSTTAFAVFGGASFDEGAFVWGAELAFEKAQIERNYVIGPVDFSLVGGTAIIPTPQVTGPGSSFFFNISQVTHERETIGARLLLDDSLALRGRLGFKIGDALLLSATAGAAVTEADLDVRQDSQQDGTHTAGFRGIITVTPLPTATSSNTVSASKTLVGVTLGALTEYKLTDNLIARADVAYTKYGDISVTTGPGSDVSIEPSTWSASLGLAFRF